MTNLRTKCYRTRNKQGERNQLASGNKSREKKNEERVSEPCFLHAAGKIAQSFRADIRAPADDDQVIASHAELHFAS